MAGSTSPRDRSPVRRTISVAQHESKQGNAGEIMWDANQYNKFAAERSRPFVDLLAAGPPRSRRHAAHCRSWLRSGNADAATRRTLARSGASSASTIPPRCSPRRSRWPFLAGSISCRPICPNGRRPSPSISFSATRLCIGSTTTPRCSHVSAGWLAPSGTLAVQMPNRFDGPIQQAIDESAADPRPGRHSSGESACTKRRCSQSSGMPGNSRTWDSPSTPGRRPTCTSSRARILCSNGFADRVCGPYWRGSKRQSRSSSPRSWPIASVLYTRRARGRRSSRCRGCSLWRRCGSKASVFGGAPLGHPSPLPAECRKNPHSARRTPFRDFPRGSAGPVRV